MVAGFAEFCLLITFYALQPNGPYPYVSTELMLTPQFNLALTVLVAFQLAATLVYIYQTGRARHPFAVAVAAVFTLVAVTGWAVLCSWNLNTGAHMWGVSVFLCGSGVDALIMLAVSPPAKARAATWVVLTVYTAGFALVIVFIANRSAGNVAVSTATEWSGFMCAAGAFTLFFATHA